MNKEYSWLRAAEILGITPRGLRRLRQRMERFGYQGLVDMRHGRPSPRRTPVPEVERILELYREKYPGFNGRHFWQIVRREHQRAALVQLRETDPAGGGSAEEGAGAGASSQATGTQRVLLARCCTSTAALTDGWSVADEREADADPGDRRCDQPLLYAQLWEGETVVAVMSALRDVLGTIWDPDFALYRPRRLGLRDAQGGRESQQDAPDTGRPGPAQRSASSTSRPTHRRRAVAASG